MIKKILILLLLVITNGAFSQSSSDKPVLISLVTKDSVFVKWVPRNFDMFKSVIDNGVDVSVSFGNTATFSDLKTTTITPLTKRWDSWDLTNPAVDKVKTILEGIVSVSAMDTSAKNYAFAMASIEASVSAEMNALSGLMLGFKKGEERFLNVRVSIKGYSTEELNVDVKKLTKNTELPPLIGSLDKKRVASIEWNAKAVNKDYLGFIIERKKENGTYEVQTKDPFIHLVTSSENKNKLSSYRDEQLEQGKKYTYRITGINYFGRFGAVSNEVEVYVPRLVNGTVEIDTIYAQKKTRLLEVKIVPESDVLPLQVHRFQVLKSSELLQGYVVVQEQKITSKDSIFSVQLPSDLETGDAFYYKVLAFSPDNDTIYSAPKYFFTLDQEPPKPITNLIGKIDSAGIVTLIWEQNVDNDLQGFRVFRANELTEEFVERNSAFVTERLFRDTLPLNTLTNEIYYFVIAVDENFNNSLNSDTVLVLKPDTIPPTAPFLMDVSVKNAMVKLTWEVSTSNDVSYQALIRKTGLVSDTLVKNPLFNARTFLDSTMVFGKEVSYFALARDRSGNTTLSKIRTTFVEPGYRPALEQVVASVDRSKKEIKISWKLPEVVPFQFFVYRKKNDGKFELISTLDGTKTIGFFIDKSLSVSTKYEYIIQYQTTEGIRSLKHVPVSVKY